ncbi:MAG: DUF3147 family protein [Gammaproteobacteria bacterium]|nr:DUF3147 family protein [Gammaproteobacteria bacterium]
MKQQTAYYTLKIVISTILIVVISEIAKRSSLIGAILASIPLVSVLAMVWLYIDTKDADKISALSTSIFWLVLPSLLLFIVLPLLLKQGLNFYLSISISITVTAFSYWIMISILNFFGVKL